MPGLITIGSDMEVFGKKLDGEHVALCGKIGGTKDEPLQLKGYPPGYMIQEDNVALEYNIPVCNSKEEWMRSFGIARDAVGKILNGMGLAMSYDASVSFDSKELSHPNALVFGCEPDYDAWRMIENEKPTAKDPNLRTAGGHIHVGSDIDMVRGVRNMDLYLGVPSVLIDNSPASKRRRELYGKAGAMRPKPYGFEYRTLSNFWQFNTELIEWVYNATKRAVHDSSPTLTEKDGEIIQRCINTGDEKLAIELCRNYGVIIPQAYRV